MDTGATDAPGPPNHLKAWRQAAGLTQRQVEKILGWNHARVSHLECGEAVLTDQVLGALAPLYGGLPADLLRGPPPPDNKESGGIDAIALLHEAERSMRRLLGDLQAAKASVMPQLEELENQIAALNTATSGVIKSALETSQMLTAMAALVKRKDKKKRHLGTLPRRERSDQP